MSKLFELDQVTPREALDMILAAMTVSFLACVNIWQDKQQKVDNCPSPVASLGKTEELEDLDESQLDEDSTFDTSTDFIVPLLMVYLILSRRLDSKRKQRNFS
jgi:hypothetical protein